MAIVSFKCTDTAKLYAGDRVRRFVNIEKVAMRKLAMLNRAEVLTDLKIPPGNHLEALSRGRRGQHSIRIIDQWRVCFIWTPRGPADVEIVDYH
jgi:proteic killer suppression protein